MGFMDKIKQAQEMAQQAGGMMSAGMPDQADMEYAQLAQKVWNSGLPGVATINSITPTGKTDATSAKEYSIAVSVELEGGEAYDTTLNQYLQDAAAASYQPGSRFEIKVDPDDKSKGLLYGAA